MVPHSSTKINHDKWCAGDVSPVDVSFWYLDRPGPHHDWLSELPSFLGLFPRAWLWDCRWDGRSKGTRPVRISRMLRIQLPVAELLFLFLFPTTSCPSDSSLASLHPAHERAANLMGIHPTVPCCSSRWASSYALPDPSYMSQSHHSSLISSIIKDRHLFHLLLLFHLPLLSHVPFLFLYSSPAHLFTCSPESITSHYRPFLVILLHVSPYPQHQATRSYRRKPTRLELSPPLQQSKPATKSVFGTCIIAAQSARYLIFICPLPSLYLRTQGLHMTSLR